MKKRVKRVPKLPLDELNVKLLGGRRPNKTVCIIRYGAIGDMMMISSVLPLLKEQGWRICLNTTSRGMELIKEDPNIDEFLVQDHGQIPIQRIEEYWDIVEECFEKVINLSESVESSLIMQPPRLVLSYGQTIQAEGHEDYFKPLSELGDKYEVNYIERTHELCEVPFEHRPKFYPTAAEKRWAKRQREKIKSDHVVMIVLSGSSTHKTYPYIDSVIARILLTHKDLSFVTVGDHTCKILEYGWEDEPRVLTKAGEWSIRKTLAFLDQVDVVIGPETGVMNAASMLPCRKIIYLSHSSVENLTKHWINTKSLSASPPCWPCHRMHIGKEHCNIDEYTGAAQCTNFDPEYIIEDINEHIPRTNATLGKRGGDTRDRPNYGY